MQYNIKLSRVLRGYTGDGSKKTKFFITFFNISYSLDGWDLKGRTTSLGNNSIYNATVFIPQ